MQHHGVSFDATSNGEGSLGSRKELSFAFNPSIMLEKVSANVTSCDNLAIQFDCYLSNEQSNKWQTGAIRWNLGLGGNEVTFTPWHPEYEDVYKEVDMSFSEGWKTLTFPLKEFANAGGKDVSDIMTKVTGKNGSFMFVFGNFDYPAGSSKNRSRGEAVTNQLFYFGNFRIVPYTKPVE